MTGSFEQHIAVEDLERYSMGRVVEPELASIEEHLLVCPSCQDSLEEVDRFIAAMRAAAEQVRATPPSSLRDLWNSAAQAFSPRLLVGAGAAAAVLAAIVWIRPGNTTAPVSVFLQSTRGLEATGSTAPTGTPLLLYMATKELAPAPSYALEIVNAAGTRVLRTNAKPENGKISLRLTKALEGGRYWVRLYHGESGELLREFGLEAK